MSLSAGAPDDPIREAADAGQLGIQSTSGERSFVMTNTQIRGLLLNGRNMLSFLSLVPGTVSALDGQVSSEGGMLPSNHTQFSSINTTTNLAVPTSTGGFATGNDIFNNYSNAVMTSTARGIDRTARPFLWGVQRRVNAADYPAGGEVVFLGHRTP